MHKSLRIVISVIMLLGCLSAALLLTEQMTMTYYLPPSQPGGEATGHTTLFRPAVTALVVVVVLTMAELGWLIWNIVTRPPAKLWFVAGAVLAAAVLIAVVVVGMPRPTF